MTDKKEPPLVKGGQGPSDEEIYETGTNLLVLFGAVVVLVILIWLVN